MRSLGTGRRFRGFGRRFRGSGRRFHRCRGHGGAGLGCVRFTEGRHHDRVIVVPPLALITAWNITGDMADARVIEVGSHNRACTGLAMSAGSRRRGRRYALTFHCSNGLLKPLEPPTLLGGLGSAGYPTVA